MDAELTHDRVAGALETRLIGRAIEVHRTVDSTNLRAAELARQGTPDGTLVLAEEQTAGRGRLGRSWLAQPRSALLFSLVLRPDLDPAQMQRLAMITALAACEAIERLYTLAPAIKWPNDIQLGIGKLGGLLCEARMLGDKLEYVIVGLGLNVNLAPAALGELLMPAASLSDALGREIERLPLLTALLELLEGYYLRLIAGWLPHTAWRARLSTLGQQVNVGLPGEVLEGDAEDVDADGALLLRLADGELRRILVGDVTLRGVAL